MKIIKLSKKVKIWIIVLAVFALIGAALAALNPFTRLTEIRKVHEGMASVVLEPIGAVQDKERGAVVDKAQFECLDEVCPHMRTAWYVPVTIGEERKLLLELVQSQGFVVTNDSSDDNILCKETFQFPCSIQAKKGRLITRLSMGGINAPLPNRDVEPKKWLFLNIDVEQVQ